jgi:integrase
MAEDYKGRIENICKIPNPDDKRSSKEKKKNPKMISNPAINNQATKDIESFYKFKSAQILLKQEQNKGKSFKDTYNIIWIVSKIAIFTNLSFREMRMDDIVDFVHYISTYRMQVITSYKGDNFQEDKSNFHESKKRKKELKPNTINNYLMQFRAFMGFLQLEDTSVYEWIKEGKKVQSSITEEDILNIEDIEGMIVAALPSRDKTIIALLYDSAARSGELENLNYSDIKFRKDEGLTVTLFGKTGERKIPLTHNSIPYVKPYLEEHLTKKPNDPLFISEKGGRLSKRRIAQMIKDAGEGANPVYHVLDKDDKPILNEDGTPETEIRKIDRNVYPHLLRHTRISHRAQQPSINEYILKEFAGWSKNSQMASIYIHHNQEQLERILLQADGVELPEEKKPFIHKLSSWICRNCGEVLGGGVSRCGKCGVARDAPIVIEDSEIKIKLKKLEIKEFYDEEKKPYENHLAEIKANFTTQQTFKSMATKPEQMTRIEGFITEIVKDISLCETKLLMFDKRQIKEQKKLEEQGSEYKLPEPSEKPDFSKPYEDYTPEGVGESEPKKIKIKPHHTISDDVLEPDWEDLDVDKDAYKKDKDGIYRKK